MPSPKRRSRTGKGLLPPNPRQWRNEHNGLNLREELGLPLATPLYHQSAFALLSRTTVLPHGTLPMPAEFVELFRTTASASWSGLGLTLPDGSTWVVYNDSHAMNRIRATLMEEFFHLRLGHPTTRLRVYADDGANRTHNSLVESEAYGSGAAALVPYQPLRTMITAGKTAIGIARFFEVSRDLVYFRAKVTRTYARLAG